MPHSRTSCARMRAGTPECDRNLHSLDPFSTQELEARGTMHISTTVAVLLVLAAPLSLSAQTGTPSDGTTGGTTGGESFTGLFRAKHTMNTKIPPRHPTISPRPSATLSGTCISADYVNDLKIGVRLYNAPANAFANIKTSQDWAYPVVQAKSSDPIRVIARASSSTGARHDAQWGRILWKRSGTRSGFR